MTTATISLHTVNSNNVQAEMLSKALRLLGETRDVLDALLPMLSPPPAAPPRPTVPSFARFPRTALFLVKTELDAASTASEFCALATTARDVRDAEPRVASEASAVLQRVTARAVRCGVHLQNVRRALAIRAVVATPGVPRPKRAATAVPAPEAPPDTLRSTPDPLCEVQPEAPPPPRFPRLARLAERETIVIVGGRDDREVVARLTREAGIDVERVGMDVYRPRVISAFAERVRAGNVGAVIAVNGFMTHAAIIPVVDATRLVGVPIAYAGKGGLRKLLRAFEDLERQLRVAAQPDFAG